MYCFIVDPRQSDATSLYSAIVGVAPSASNATGTSGDGAPMKACKKRKRQRPTPSRLFAGK